MSKKDPAKRLWRFAMSKRLLTTKIDYHGKVKVIYNYTSTYCFFLIHISQIFSKIKQQSFIQKCLPYEKVCWFMHWFIDAPLQQITAPVWCVMEVLLLRCYWSCFHSGFHLPLGSSGQVSWVKHSNNMVNKTMLKKEICISVKLVSRWKHELI